MMVEIGDMQVMQILSFATNTIAEGEVQQLTNIRNPNITEASYLEVIDRKTAMLFQASSHAGAVLSASSNKGVEAEQVTGLRGYGQHLGMAFQLVDDLLDYEGSAEQLGKNVGDDLAEGKITLPIIAAMQNSNKAETDLLVKAILNGGLELLDDVMDIVKRRGGLEYTTQRAEQEIKRALDCLKILPESEYKKAMQDLANFSISRDQ